MAPRPKLSLEQATEMKRIIFDGASNADVANMFGVSIPTVVNIKGGRQYYEAPWPSGTVGAMPEHQNIANGNNRRFVTRAENTQYIPFAERTYRSLSAYGQDQLDKLARTITCDKCGKADFDGWIQLQYHNEMHADERRQAEHARQMEEARKRQEAYEATWINGEPPVDTSRQLPDPDGPLDPSQQDIKYSWQDVLYIAAKNPLVQTAESEADEAMKAAILTIYSQVGVSQWEDATIIKMCLDLKPRFQKFLDMQDA